MQVELSFIDTFICSFQNIGIFLIIRWKIGDFRYSYKLFL